MSNNDDGSLQSNNVEIAINMSSYVDSIDCCEESGKRKYEYSTFDTTKQSSKKDQIIIIISDDEDEVKFIDEEKKPAKSPTMNRIESSSVSVSLDWIYLGSKGFSSKSVKSESSSFITRLGVDISQESMFLQYNEHLNQIWFRNISFLTYGVYRDFAFISLLVNLETARKLMQSADNSNMSDRDISSYDSQFNPLTNAHTLSNPIKYLVMITNTVCLDIFVQQISKSDYLSKIVDFNVIRYLTGHSFGDHDMEKYLLVHLSNFLPNLSSSEPSKPKEFHSPLNIFGFNFNFLICCARGHSLVPQQKHTDLCDASLEIGGCKSCSNMNKAVQWVCKSCDFYYCSACYDFKSAKGAMIMNEMSLDNCLVPTSLHNSLEQVCSHELSLNYLKTTVLSWPFVFSDMVRIAQGQSLKVILSSSSDWNLKMESSDKIHLLLVENAIMKRANELLTSKMYPSIWGIQSNNEMPQPKLVNLLVVSLEYQMALSHFLDGFSANVLTIHRVENCELYNEYCTKRREIANRLNLDQNSPFLHERILKHGPRATNPSAIWNSGHHTNTYGFDFRFSRPGLYGKGAYFAEDTAYAHKYAHRLRTGSKPIFQIFLASVVAGNIQERVTNKPDTIHPDIPYNSIRGPLNEANQHGIIVYSLHQSYPAYLVTYNFEF